MATALGEADYQRLLALAGLALDSSPWEKPWPRILDQLRTDLGCSIATSIVFSESAHHIKVLDWQPASIREDLLDHMAHEEAFHYHHPLRAYYQSDGHFDPASCDQVVGSRTWRNSATYSLIHRQFGTSDVLGIPVGAEPSGLRGLILQREGRAFDDRALVYSTAVQGLMIRVDRHYRELDRWSQSADGRAPVPTDRVDRADSHGLTPREITVLALLAEAHTAGSIASRLGISVRTVHKHVENLYRKLGTRDRVATVLRAQQLGLLPRAGQVVRG